MAKSRITTRIFKAVALLFLGLLLFLWGVVNVIYAPWFQDEARKFYDLERLWSDAEVVDISDMRA